MRGPLRRWSDDLRRGRLTTLEAAISANDILRLAAQLQHNSPQQF
jgi:hypothetical protein